MKVRFHGGPLANQIEEREKAGLVVGFETTKSQNIKRIIPYVSVAKTDKLGKSDIDVHMVAMPNMAFFWDMSKMEEAKRHD